MARNATKQDENTREVKKTVTLIRLFGYLLTYKLKILAVLLIMVITTAITIYNPLLIERAINVHIKAGDTKSLISLCVLGVILNIIMVMLIKLRMYIMATISNEVLVTIRQELYEHIQKLGFKFFDNRPTGKILARIMGDVNSLKDVLTNSVTTLIPDAITIITVVIVMMLKDWRLGLAALWSLPVMILGIMWDQSRAHAGWQLFRKKNSNLNAFIHEDVAGIRVIQSFGAEEETQETFDELVEEHNGSFIKACMYSDLFGPIIDICWAAGLIAMYYVGIRIVGAESVAVGTLVAFGTYIGMFWQPVMNLSNYYNQMVTNVAGAERIFEIMDAEPEIVDKDGAEDLMSIRGEVEFDNVSFDYDDADDKTDGRDDAGELDSQTKANEASSDNSARKNTVALNRGVQSVYGNGRTMCKVLNNVSFKVAAGETIALVGPTGAGKTTVVNLIARFYDICAGRLLIDGKDIRDITVDSLRSKMGIMTQDNFLFTGTVRDNIRYGRLDATDEEIEAAAKAVSAHEFITKLENGYDTEIKERGAGLSAGQRQLIAFARTMVSNPSILILDEATSSIDTHTEQLVQQGIESLLKGRTSFVIAHRLSTIRNADRIFVVDKGGIVESGSPAELMAKKGEYYKLYMAQKREEEF
ncbi:MAG: ABC transporter ATP-binding protein/permease [Lachnospiraceae bacterium]|nr:ABC transporter ATP-binding protein/permease [Lachnospiraceae bacterium]